MQFLLVSKSDTLVSLSRIIGAQNIDLLLAENGLKREPNIGKQYYQKCDDLLATHPQEVPAARKSALLNGLTDSEEVFEKACLMDEDEWKIFSAFQSFNDALRVPESVKLPYSTRIIGAAISESASISLGSGVSGSRKRTTTQGSSSQVEPVSSTTYRTIMNQVKETGSISPEIFNKVNTSSPVSLDASRSLTLRNKVPQYSYNLPWGKIQIYSSLMDELVDIPAYPEEVETERTASYAQMPDLIYQYEPWVVYESSGPRSQQLNFHLHRDMWSGNHLDGQANRLIRFCEANTFPKYNGSNVLTPTVKVYINGALFIGGVMIRTTVNWSGPIGLDNWYLDFQLGLTIQEVSEFPLNITSVPHIGLIGT